MLAGSTAPVAVQRVAAVRELFEETGVLLARRADNPFPTDAELAGPRADSSPNPTPSRRSSAGSA